MACGCSNYSIKADKVWKSAWKQKLKRNEAKILTRNVVQHPASAAKKIQKIVKAPAKKTDQKPPVEPYKGVLVFSEASEV